MKCKIDKIYLQNMLSKVQGFTEKKSTLPILSHVLLETDEHGLTVKATDLHTSIEVKSKCEVDEFGSCAINGKSFFEVIRELPDDQLQIWTENNSKAHIVVGKFKTHMNVMDPEEYPAIDLSDVDNGFLLDSLSFKFMVDRTIFSIPVSAESDTQYTLGGALLTSGSVADKPYIEMVTTDSRRLSVSRHVIAEVFDMGSGIIIPRKGLQELKRLIDNKEDESKILLTKDSIFFSSANTTATVRLIDGKFPDHKSIISLGSYPVYSRISAVSLLNALKVCSAMVSEISNCVKFTFSKGKILLYANNPDQGDVEIPLDAEHEGEEIEINFNPRYFIDCLTHIEGDAEIRLKGSHGPCLVTSFGMEDCKWVIMPMRF